MRRLESLKMAKFEKHTKYILLKESTKWHSGAGSFLPGEIMEELSALRVGAKISLRKAPIGDETPEFENLLTCLISDVGKLTDSEADLLMAVGLEKRLSIYVENSHQLKFGKDLKLGSEVLVRLEDGQNQSAGIVRYKGPHSTPNTHPGVWFRVELKNLPGALPMVPLDRIQRADQVDDYEEIGAQNLMVPSDNTQVLANEIRSYRRKVLYRRRSVDSDSCYNSSFYTEESTNEDGEQMDQGEEKHPFKLSLQDLESTPFYIEGKKKLEGEVKTITNISKECFEVTVEVTKKRFARKSQPQSMKVTFCPRKEMLSLDGADQVADPGFFKDKQETRSKQYYIDEEEIGSTFEYLDQVLLNEQRESYFNGQLEAYQRELELERIEHAKTDSDLKREHEHHAITHDELQWELQAHSVTKDKLQAETQAHASTRNQLKMEQQAYASAREELRKQKRQHKFNSDTHIAFIYTYFDDLKNEKRDHEHTKDELQMEQQAHEITRQELQQEREINSVWILDRSDIEMTEEIGKGAYGTVMKGKFQGTDVAVKQMHGILSSGFYKRLFKREMNIASQCHHPCLLQLIGATSDDRSPLLVTELLDTNLRSVLEEEGRLQLPQVIIIALDVAKALNYLHLKQPAPIIHRDVTSANVLLWKRDDMWRAKVSDYGAANFMQYASTACPGAVVYSAPEAQTSRQSPKIDVYSFGVLVCEMSIGEFPVPPERERQVSKVSNHDLHILIRNCLRRNPNKRPSMTDIILYLDDL